MEVMEVMEVMKVMELRGRLRSDDVGCVRAVRGSLSTDPDQSEVRRLTYITSITFITSITYDLPS